MLVFFRRIFFLLFAIPFSLSLYPSVDNKKKYDIKLGKYPVAGPLVHFA